MAEQVDELFVKEVEIGVGTLDRSTDDGVVSERVVVERVAGADRASGEDRNVVVIYAPEDVEQLADHLRTAAQVAMAETP
ncbi:MAG: hypothetical protein JWM85_759 [Acidimicrobiaceae bacterium]|nr:hypothetical protein [Acidimicrobiaceae bacterium]